MSLLFYRSVCSLAAEEDKVIFEALFFVELFCWTDWPGELSDTEARLSSTLPALFEIVIIALFATALPLFIILISTLFVLAGVKYWFLVSTSSNSLPGIHK